MNSRQEKISKDIETTKDVIIDVLREALQNSDGCLSAAEISRRCGLFHDSGYGIKNNFNDSQVNGLLKVLYIEGKVRKCLQKSGRIKDRVGWKIK